MKLAHFISFSLLFLSITAHSSETLHIKFGETYVVPLAESRLFLERLVLEDNVVIQFAEGVTHWHVTAVDAVIGAGVFINARGKAGEPGLAAVPLNIVAGDCESGSEGLAGGNGGAGESGVTITLDLNLRKLGNLEIDARGGSGGQGGDGGPGQAAGVLVKCKAPTGGNGGTGGIGGKGGDGGSVAITYSFAKDTKPFDVTSLISVANSSGDGGAGGSGGEPGAGTEGRYVSMRTLTGNRRWVAGGAAGNVGVVGSKGAAGVDGLATVTERLEKKLLRMVQEEIKSKQRLGVDAPLQAETDYQQLFQTLQQLSKQVQALQQRVELLEQANSNP